MAGPTTIGAYVTDILAVQRVYYKQTWSFFELQVRHLVPGPDKSFQASHLFTLTFLLVISALNCNHVIHADFAFFLPCNK